MALHGTGTVTQETVGFVEEQDRLGAFSLFKGGSNLRFRLTDIHAQKIARLAHHKIAAQGARDVAHEFCLAGSRRTVEQDVQRVRS